MTGTELVALLVLVAILAGWVGALVGYWSHREQVRMRGEATLRALHVIGVSGVWGEDLLPRVAVLRAVAKLAANPDPYPLTRPTSEEPLT